MIPLGAPFASQTQVKTMQITLILIILDIYYRYKTFGTDPVCKTLKMTMIMMLTYNITGCCLHLWISEPKDGSDTENPDVREKLRFEVELIRLHPSHLLLYLFRLSPDRLVETMSVPGLGVGAPEVKSYDDGVDGGDDDGDDNVGDRGGWEWYLLLIPKLNRYRKRST